MEVLVKNEEENQQPKSRQEALIFCDCKAAIEVVGQQKELQKRKRTFKSIGKIMEKLSIRNITVKLVWCPGHCAIKWNDTADRLAKEKARSMKHQYKNATVTSQVSREATTRMIKNKMSTMWQKSWDNSTTGHATRLWIPKVATQIHWSKTRSVDMSYARLLLNSANICEHLHRMKFADSATCECNLGRETINHFLLECLTYADARKIMIDTIQSMWLKNPKPGNLNISVELLLSPEAAKLSKDEDTLVKQAMLEFLAATSRAL